MKVTVKYFASLREALRCESEVIDVPPGATVSDLRAVLRQRGEPHSIELALSQAIHVAVDHTLTNDQCLLHEHCEVAFFPPVTGG